MMSRKRIIKVIIVVTSASIRFFEYKIVCSSAFARVSGEQKRYYFVVSGIEDGSTKGTYSNCRGSEFAQSFFDHGV